MALLSVKQNAKFWGFSESWIYRHWPELHGFKVGSRIRFNKEDQEKLRERLKDSQKRLTSLLPININSGGRKLLTKVRSLAFVKNGEYLSGTVYVRKTRRGWRWYINFSFRGRRVRKVALLAQTEEEALIVLQEEMRKAFDHEYGVVHERKKILFKDFSEPYLETYAKVRKKSWRSDEKYLKSQLIPFFGEMELSEITPLTVDQYIAKRQKDGVKNSTINRELTVLKKMLSLAIEWQFSTHGQNPVKRARYFSEEKYKRDRVLSTKEEISLFQESAPHLKSILTCALQTGMRVGEILGLKWKNVSPEKHEILIKAESSKSGKARIIPITNTLLYELRRLEGRPHGGDHSDRSDQFVFLYKSRPVKSIQVAFTNARLRAGIKDLTFHDLRHTFASRLASKGASPVSVKNILGHANLKTTEIYLHSNLKQMREAIELLDDCLVTARQIPTAVGEVPSLICHRSKKGKKKKPTTIPFSMN